MEKLESAMTLQADKKKEQRSFQKCPNELLKNTTVSITPHYPVNRDFLPVTNRTGQQSVCQEHAGSYICGSPTHPLCLSPMMLTFLYSIFYSLLPTENKTDTSSITSPTFRGAWRRKGSTEVNAFWPE